MTEAGQRIPAVEWTLELTGSGLSKPGSFTYEQLARMEMSQLNDILQQMSHFPDKTTSWRGPSVESLLVETRIKPGPMIFTLEAADGYRMRCTRDDLESAIVALQDGEGNWLAEVGTHLPIRLIPPKKTGDYWVLSIRRIIVEPAGAGE